VLRIGKLLATVLTVLVLTLYFGRAFDARRMPALGPEHIVEFDSEFQASAENETDWADYLAIERILASELSEKIPSESRRGSPVDRYFAESLTSPDSYAGTSAAWRRRLAARVDGLAIFDAGDGADNGGCRLQCHCTAHAWPWIRRRWAPAGARGGLDRSGSCRHSSRERTARC
jgi:hypothetical protein